LRGFSREEASADRGVIANCDFFNAFNRHIYRNFQKLGKIIV